MSAAASDTRRCRVDEPSRTAAHCFRVRRRDTTVRASGRVRSSFQPAVSALASSMVALQLEHARTVVTSSRTLCRRYRYRRPTDEPVRDVVEPCAALETVHLLVRARSSLSVSAMTAASQTRPASARTRPSTSLRAAWAKAFQFTLPTLFANWLKVNESNG